MKFKLKHLMLVVAIAAVTFGIYASYQRIFYELVSVSEQHGKPGIWTDENGKRFEHPVTYHIAHRKRYGWLPGSDWILGGLSKQQYQKRSESAVSYDEWDKETTYGKAFYFVNDPTDLYGDPVTPKPLNRLDAR